MMGRLIDVDEYEKRIKPYDTEDVMDKALYNFAHEKLITTSTAQPKETQLAQEIWVKTCMITDADGLQHEVIHYGALRKVIFEVLGWQI